METVETDQMPQHETGVWPGSTLFAHGWMDDDGWLAI